MRSTKSFATLAVVFVCLSIRAQQPTQFRAQPAGSNWQRVRQLPPQTRVHISSDRMSRVCSIDVVEEDKLTCSAGRVVSISHFVFPRAEIKSIQATRYLGSAAGGLGIGAGAGLIFGFAVAHKGGDDQIVSNKEIWAGTSAAGAVIGAAIGGPTDFLRGPTIYRRQKN
jgi:hypothetical protein